MAAVALCSGCVVTTYEGVGEPPRVAAAPKPPAKAGSTEGPASTSGDGASAALKNPNETIAASHILVQYQGSLRAPPTIVRTKEEARARAEQALERAKKGEDFAALAAEYSDEPGAAQRGGNIGTFARSAVVRQFADAAFALKPGELSGIVETPFGFHVIKRTQ